MSNKAEAVRRLICTAVYLGFMRMCYRLYNGVPVFSVNLDEVSKASEDFFGAYLYLAPGLWIVCGRGEVFNTKQGVQRYKEFAGDLYIVGGEKHCCNAVQYISMIKEKLCNVRRRLFGCRYRVCSCRIAICDDEDVLIVLHRFRKWSKDYHRDKFESFGCWKESKLAFTAVCCINLGATL